MIGLPATTPGVIPANAPAPRQAEAAARPPVAPPPLREDEQVPMPAEVSFGDFLAALNPLHHIPVVGWIYRQVTGETIQPVFRVLGGLITGGPIGAIASAVGALAEQLLGDADTGQQPAGGTAVAAATPSATPAATAIAANAATATAPALAAGAAAAPAPGSLAAIVTAAGQPLQPLPLATRLAARAYPAPSLPMREAAPLPDPVAAAMPAAVVPAAIMPAAAMPAPQRARAPAEATPTEAAAAVAMPAEPPSPPGAAPQARVRRAAVVPVTSGGQDPAFMQQMMRGLEAYERAMRARTGAAPQPATATAGP